MLNLSRRKGLEASITTAKAQLRSSVLNAISECQGSIAAATTGLNPDELEAVLPELERNGLRLVYEALRGSVSEAPASSLPVPSNAARRTSR